MILSILNSTLIDIGTYYTIVTICAKNCTLYLIETRWFRTGWICWIHAGTLYGALWIWLYVLYLKHYLERQSKLW